MVNPQNPQRLSAAAPTDELLDVTVDHEELRTWLRSVTDIAGAVTLHRPLSVLLDLLASKAGELMGYEFCAVLLANEQRGLLEISGSFGLSAEYASKVSSSLSFQLGSQLAGESPSSRAFLTHLPVVVEDVLVDSSFRPWGSLAEEQGFRSLVSVPLLINGRAVGTLNGYRAQPCRFHQDEILLLAALANLAGTAIETARLAEREQQTIDQLQRLNTSLQAQALLLEQAEEIHQKLTSVALRAGGLGTLASVLAGLLSRSVLVEGPNFEVLAVAAHAGGMVDAPPTGSRVDPEGVLLEVPAWPGAAQDCSRISVPVFLDRELVARFWLPGRVAELSALDLRAIDHAVVVAGLELMRERTALEVEWALRGDLLAELLSDRSMDSMTIIPRASSLGHDLRWPHAVLVVRADVTEDAAEGPTGNEQRRVLKLVQASTRSTTAPPLATIRDDYVVVLWPVPRSSSGTDLTADEAAESIRQHCARGLAESTVSVAVGPPCTEVREYAEAFRMQRGALELARLQGHRDRTITLPSLGFYGLLLQLDAPSVLKNFADQTLAPLRHYDAAKHTELVATLQAYLNHELNTAQTAAALFLHPNTVGLRLKRIESLLSVSLTKPEHLLLLKAALMTNDVLGVGGGRSHSGKAVPNHSVYG